MAFTFGISLHPAAGGSSPRRRPRLLVVADMSDHTHVALARGARRIASAKNWELRLCVPQTEAVETICYEWPPNFVLFSERLEAEYVRAFCGNAITVAMNTNVQPEEASSDRPTQAAVLPDDAAIGELAADHFAGLNLRHVGVLTQETQPFAVARADAFCARAKQLGMETIYRQDLFELTPNTHLTLPRLWKQYAPPSGEPLGMFTCCDSWGELVIDIAFATNVAIPEELAVVSADNHQRCEIMHPPLSSIDIGWERMGAEGALLADRLRSGQARPGTVMHIPPGDVIVRASSDLRYSGNESVAAAIDYLHSNYGRKFSVDDMAAALSVNRRKLERGFRAELGRSILEELRRFRMQQAKSMLSSTNKSIAEIAAACGYSSSNRFGIAFRAVFDHSASEYRKQSKGPAGNG